MLHETMSEQQLKTITIKTKQHTEEKASNMAATDCPIWFSQSWWQGQFYNFSINDTFIHNEVKFSLFS